MFRDQAENGIGIRVANHGEMHTCSNPFMQHALRHLQLVALK
jgi:hypothetical protein